MAFSHVRPGETLLSDDEARSLLGEAAELVYTLMAHFTRPEHVYAHEWGAGDLVVYDNRCTVHAATWFDDSIHSRIMWRTTVSGNPGALYAGEAPSWRAA